MKKYIRMAAMLLAAFALASCTPVQDMLEGETADLTPPANHPVDMTDIPDYLSMPLDQYVTLGQYRDLEVRLDTVILTDEQVNEAIEGIKKANGKFKKITDRLVEWGDTLVLSYTASVQGDEGSYAARDVEVKLAEGGEYSDEFVRALVGAPCKMPVTITVEEQQAGEAVTVNYQVTVSYIIGEFEELTDAFVSAYTDGACTKADEFFAYYKEQLWNELYYETVYDALWDTCVSNCEVTSVPDEAVRYYVDSMEEYYRAMAAKNGVTYQAVLDAFDLDEAKIKELAMGYAEKDLIFYAIVADAGMQITEQQYDSALDEYATKYYSTLSTYVGKGSGEGGKVTIKDVKVYLDGQQRNMIRELCYDDMMYDFLYDNNKIFVGDVPMN